MRQFFRDDLQRHQGSYPRLTLMLNFPKKWNNSGFPEVVPKGFVLLWSCFRGVSDSTSCQILRPSEPKALKAGIIEKQDSPTWKICLEISSNCQAKCAWDILNDPTKMQTYTFTWSRIDPPQSEIQLKQNRSEDSTFMAEAQSTSTTLKPYFMFVCI